MLNRLTFAWRCRLRAVSLSSRMMDAVLSCSGLIDVADRMGGAIPFSGWLRTEDGLHALESVESRLVSALAAINAARGNKGESP